MRIMRQINPEGIELRKKRRLKRRLYSSKVRSYVYYFFVHVKWRGHRGPKETWSVDSIWVLRGNVQV